MLKLLLHLQEKVPTMGPFFKLSSPHVMVDSSYSQLGHLHYKIREIFLSDGLKNIVRMEFEKTSPFTHCTIICVADPWCW